MVSCNTRNEPGKRFRRSEPTTWTLHAPACKEPHSVAMEFAARLLAMLSANATLFSSPQPIRGIQMSHNDLPEIKIMAFITAIDCPRCEHPNMGFVNDPRGGTFECDGCNETYSVPEDATVDFG